MSVRKVVVGIVYRKKERPTTEGRHTPDNITFLVLHRVLEWKGWEFPKGGVEKTDKTEESALLRELDEEAGLKRARVIERLPYKIRYKYPIKYADKYKHSETEQSVFIVRSFQEEITLPSFSGVGEHDDFRWLPYPEARKMLTHADQKKALDIAQKILKASN